MKEPYKEKAKYVDLLWKNKNKKQIDFISFIKNRYFGKRGVSLIEAGCGNGRLIFRLMKKIPIKKCWGYDTSKDMLNHARLYNKYKNVKFVFGDMKDFVPPYKFNILICMYTSFNYLLRDNQIISALNSFKKSINKKGVIVIDASNLFDSAMMVQKNKKRRLFFKNKKLSIRQDILISYDAKNNIWNHKENLHIEGGKPKKISELHKLRYITISEMNNFCKELKLKIEKVFFGYDYKKNKNEHRLIFVIRKK